MQELEEAMEAGEEVQQEAWKTGEGHRLPEPWQLGLGLPEESIRVRSGTAAAGNRRRRGGGTAAAGAEGGGGGTSPGGGLRGGVCACERVKREGVGQPARP